MEVMVVVIPKKRTGCIVAFMASFPFTNTMLIPHMPFVFTCLSRNRYTSFYASIDMSMLAQYRFHVYLVVNPKKELEIKMVSTAGLHDISAMYITLETSYVFILYVYYLRIKLTGFCQHRHSIYFIFIWR